MPNMKQAPTLINPRGAATVKHKDEQFYFLPIDLMTIICNELSGKAGNQLKVMMLLVGSQDTSKKTKKAFTISEGLIKKRLGMSQTRYVEARNALKERGWIEHKDGKITVLYDNIYNAASESDTENNSSKEDEPETVITSRAQKERSAFDTVPISNSKTEFDF